MMRTGSTSEVDSKPRVLIVTALALEFLAVRAHLQDVKEKELPLGMIADSGRFEAGSRSWVVSVIETGMGNERAALETERAIQALDPQLVLFVGIAGGIKGDVGLGDVIVPYKVYTYDYGKDGDRFNSRPEAPEPSYRAFQRALAVGRDDAWHRSIRVPDHLALSRNPPRVSSKAIAAGGKVVAGLESRTASLIREHFSDAAAVEMEGYGFLRALHAHPDRQALVIRGISDLVDHKVATDAQGWQSIAAANAAGFAFAFLSRFSSETPRQDQGAVREGTREFWTALWEVAIELCPAGPMHERIWQRAGGDPSRLQLGTTPQTMWFDAIDLLRRGGGGEINAASLLRVLKSEFPNAVLDTLIRNAQEGPSLSGRPV